MTLRQGRRGPEVYLRRIHLAAMFLAGSRWERIGGRNL